MSVKNVVYFVLLIKILLVIQFVQTKSNKIISHKQDDVFQATVSFSVP